MPSQLNMNKNIIFVIICSLTAIKGEKVTISPSNPKAAFQYKGKLIPDLSYGNIRLEINTTNLFHGTKELCQAGSLLQR